SAPPMFPAPMIPIFISAPSFDRYSDATPYGPGATRPSQPPRRRTARPQRSSRPRTRTAIPKPANRELLPTFAYLSKVGLSSGVGVRLWWGLRLVVGLGARAPGLTSVRDLPCGGRCRDV